jgi:hypothetical protein
MNEIEKRARANGIWIDPDKSKPIPVPPPAEGQADRPPLTLPSLPQNKPGQPSQARRSK